MNEYNSKALRWVLELLLGGNAHKNVYEDPLLKKMGPVSPEALRSIEERERGKKSHVYSGRL